jgi:hypothetical protein
MRLVVLEGFDLFGRLGACFLCHSDLKALRTGGERTNGARTMLQFLRYRPRAGNALSSTF